MNSEPYQWSKLPKDMVLMVAGKLDSNTDVLRLRAVCSSWRSYLPRRTWKRNSPFFSVKLPFHAAPNPAYDPKRAGNLTLCERTIFYLQQCKLENPNSRSSKGWMVSVEESKPGKMRVLDPLSNYKFINLPIISSKVLNLLNCRISEVCRVTILQFVGDRNFDLDELKLLNMIKVVTSPIKENIDELAILVIHTGGKLGFFKFGDEKWSLINDSQERPHYEDIIYCNGKFYAIDYTGGLIVIDSSVDVNAIVSPVVHHGMRLGDMGKYLVESLGDLYLLVKHTWDNHGFYSESDFDEDYNFPTIGFRVYMFKDNDKKWVEVKNLGDRAFFIGVDWCFSVSASVLSGCKSNCIYFTDIDFLNGDEIPGFGMGMFDLESGKIGTLSSFKNYFQIFWPPPAWIMPKSSSKSSSSRRQ